MSFSLAQQKALAIMPKISSPLSIMGSAFMATDVLRDRKKRQQTYGRIVLGASSMDLATNWAFFCSTWPIPRGAPQYGASGTTGTCTFQGFFVQLGVGLSLYLGCLMLYYMLVITFQWSEYRVKKIEKWMHIGVLSVSIGTAIAGLPLTLYNNAILWCWISSLPFDCANTRSSSGNCIRGDHAWIFRWAFFYAPVWFVILFVIVSMATVSYSVWSGERASRQYRSYGGSGQTSNKLNSLARQTYWQGALYVCAFFLGTIPGTVVRLQQTLEREVSFAALLLLTITGPLRGFLNCIVYIRPRYARLRTMDRKASCWAILIRAICVTFPWIPTFKPKRWWRGRRGETRTDEMTDDDGEEEYDEEEYGAEEDAELLNPAQTLQEKRQHTEIEEVSS